MTRTPAGDRPAGRTITGAAGGSAAAAAVTAAWRIESARVIAALTRITRDLSLAEDLAQDAFVAAVEQWPDDGIPANPGAWLMAVAKRRAIDHFRHTERRQHQLDRLGHALSEAAMPDLAAQADHIEDDVLRLLFLTCHPVLSPPSRAALTLRLVGGLTTEEIARGFLVKETAVGQRISRAKRTLTESGATLDLPTGAARTARLDDVLAVIYLIFNEGYTATTGTQWTRPALCSEALRLARTLAALIPGDAEVHGLQALLELQASRLPARTTPEGDPVLLEEQDRGRWDRLLIRRGLAALALAESKRQTLMQRPVGVYAVQAAIAACHARARRSEDTDWGRIAALYDLLSTAGDNPVVEVNRAVAHGRAFGPDAGLAVLDAIRDEHLTTRSHLLAAVRGDLLERAARHAEAAQAFRTAAALTGNERERHLLQERSTRSRSAASSTHLA